MTVTFMLGRTSGSRNVIHDGYRYCLLTISERSTNKGETLLLWDSTFSAERIRSFLFGTVENMDRLAEAPHLVQHSW